MQNAEKTIRDLFGTALFKETSISGGILNTLNGSGCDSAGAMSGTSVQADVLNHDNGNGLIHDFTGPKLSFYEIA